MNDLGQTPRPAVVFFDLDGTIADSAPGITSRIAAALVACGHERPSDEQLRRYVGPPILEGFRTISGLNESEAFGVLRQYRSLVADVGPESDSALFPGMREIIQDLDTMGMPIALSTSKPESQATRILEHYGLAEHFTVIAGASEDERRSKKADVIAEAIRRLDELGVAHQPAVLVGDRSMDVEGGAAHGIPTIFVRWGYGSREEERGALIAVDDSAALRDALGLPSETMPAEEGSASWVSSAVED